MNGLGTSGGAGTVINAFATGRGAAFGLGLHVRARVEPARAWSVHAGRRRLPPQEARLGIETARAFAAEAGTRGPFQIWVESDIPAKKGLKSSSAVGVAVARAVLAQAEARVSAARLLRLVADAAVRSGTSLTGAMDDAAACLLGGVVFADNLHRRILKRRRLPLGLHALLHIPPRTLATGSLDRKAFLPVAPMIEEAWDLALRGRLQDAMLLNTFAYAPIVRVRPAFTLRALTHGAYAAGLSGKGPAEVALVHDDDLHRFRRLFPRARIVPVNAGGARP